MGAHPKSSDARRVKTSGRRRSSLPELVRILPQRQLIYLWLAIFNTFAMIGFVLDILTRGRQPVTLLALNVIFSGVIAIGYAMVSMPMRKWGYLAIFTAHMAYVVVVPRLFSLQAGASSGRLTLDAIGIIVTVAIGYTFFLRFISVTATRYIRAQAEIDLARDIHRVLVPAVARRIGDFEFLGWSHASGDVGGDLVDIVEQDEGWLGYLPVLRARNGHVEEVTSPQIAVGMLDGTTFSSSSAECLPGDVLALLTDGLIEVFDGKRDELGLDWAKGVLGSSDGQPLSAIADRLLADARAHGAQLDDQTLLLIRRVAN